MTGNNSLPAVGCREADKSFAAGSKLSLTPVAADPLDELARQISGAFVVVVETNGGQYRRRVFLTVAAAERHSRRAQDAGHNATVYLAELKPLWRLNGGAVAS